MTTLVRYFLIADVKHNVHIKICTLKGGALADIIEAALTDGADARYGVEMYVTVQLYSNGKPLGLPVSTPYRAFLPGQPVSWDEWLVLDAKYCDLSPNSRIAFTVWRAHVPDFASREDNQEHPAAVIVGGSSLPCFNKKGLLKVGNRHIVVWEGKRGDGSSSSSTPHTVPPPVAPTVPRMSASQTGSLRPVTSPTCPSSPMMPSFPTPTNAASASVSLSAAASYSTPVGARRSFVPSPSNSSAQPHRVSNAVASPPPPVANTSVTSPASPPQQPASTVGPPLSVYATALDKLERIQRKYALSELPPVPWLDKLTARQIDRMARPDHPATLHRNASSRLLLEIDCPPFPHPVVYYSTLTANPTGQSSANPPQNTFQQQAPLTALSSDSRSEHRARLTLVADPLLQRDNPISKMYSILASKASASVLSQRNLRMDWQERRRVEAIVESRGFQKALTGEEKRLLLKFRYSLLKYPRALAKFLSCMDPNNTAHRAQVADMLEEWCPLDVPTVLELMALRYKFESLKRFTIKQLEAASDDELDIYLPQLVQALRFEERQMCSSPLADFLLDRCSKNFVLVNSLHWIVNVESCRKDDKYAGEYKTLLGLFYDKLVQSRPDWAALLSNEILLIRVLTELHRAATKDGGNVANKVNRLKTLIEPSTGYMRYVTDLARHCNAEGLKAANASVEDCAARLRAFQASGGVDSFAASARSQSPAASPMASFPLSASQPVIVLPSLGQSVRDLSESDVMEGTASGEQDASDAVMDSLAQAVATDRTASSTSGEALIDSTGSSPEPVSPVLPDPISAAAGGQYTTVAAGAQSPIGARLPLPIIDTRAHATGANSELAALQLALSNATALQMEYATQAVPLRMPTKPLVEIIGLIPSSTSMFKSKLAPLNCTYALAPPENSTAEGGGASNSNSVSGKQPLQTYKAIFKCGDDLRQDQLVIQLITLMDSILQTNYKLNLRLTPYKVLVASVDSGLVEFVVKSHTITSILEDYGRDISKFFRTYNAEGPELDACMDNYVNSSAGYCVITYLLDIGDRHLENVLLTTDGRLFHIDFGWIFGRDPKPFPPPMKFSKEMVEGMGGSNSPHYRHFRQKICLAFNFLRRHSSVILSMLSLMRDAGIPDLSVKQNADEVLLKVQSNFRLALTDEEASRYILQKVDASVNALFPSVLDQVHKWAMYWK